jgi:hypothetical protein
MSETKEQKFESTLDGKKVQLKILAENLDIERKCDTEYHLAYTQLMAKGILPKSTLERRMAEKGIWTDEDQDQLDEIQQKLAQLQLKLDDAKTFEDGLEIASAMGELRSECLRLVEVKAAVVANSCESLADQVRRDAYLAFATVYSDTNKPVFADYDDFLGRATEQVVEDARQALLSTATQAFSDSLNGLPEVSYVRNAEATMEAEAEAAAAAEDQKKRTAKKTAKKRTTRKAPVKKA